METELQKIKSEKGCLMFLSLEILEASQR